MRTIEEIKEAMTSAFMNDTAAQTAYGFGEGEKFAAHFSKASIESILFYVFAVCAYTIERLTATHLTEVEQLLTALRPHTLTWYQTKALAFRLGESINPDTADYDTEATTDTSLPVAQCAVSDAEEGGIVIKVATTDANGDLCALNTTTLSAFSSYINDVKDAGIRTTILSTAGDRLKLNMIVYVDGTMFAADGSLLSEPSKPVQTAVKEYLTKLPFDGELVLEHLTDYLQQVEGVEVPHVVKGQVAAVSSDSQNSSGYEAFTDIDVRTTPASGYFKVSFDSSDDWCSTVEYRIK